MGGRGSKSGLNAKEQAEKLNQENRMRNAADISALTQRGLQQAVMQAEETKPDQKPTKAKYIENMNEAQLDLEIAKQQRIIDSANRAMGNIPQSENIGAIPLTQTMRGKTQSQINRVIERSVGQSRNFTDAYKKRERAQKKLAALQKAKNEVAGTGKTQSELQKKKQEKAKAGAKQTLQWKQTSKGGWEGGGYSPKIIKAGNLEIHGNSGYYSVYKDGVLKMQGVSKLSDAKAYAEKLKAR